MAMSIPGFPGLSPNESSLKRIVATIGRLLAGKTNNVTSVTLTANSATTTMSDPRIGAYSFIGFTPTTAHAKAEGTPEVTAKDTGTATLSHANNAQTDRTYDVVIIG
jgi:hypothetical protein